MWKLCGGKTFKCTKNKMFSLVAIKLAVKGQNIVGDDASGQDLNPRTQEEGGTMRLPSSTRKLVPCRATAPL